MKFALKLLHRIGENPQLVQEPGASAKEHMMQDVIPGSGALSGISPEEMRIQGLDGRKLADEMAVVDNRLAG